MNRALFASLGLASISCAALGGCGSDLFIEVDGQGQIAGDGGVDAGTTGGTFDFRNGSRIAAYLEGKRLVMEGANIPTDPNGFNENINFGQATQCYVKTEMAQVGGRVTVSSDLGTLRDAPMTGDRGMCDRTALSNRLVFDSTAVVFDGNGDCFDFTITYPGFGQEGRGRIRADGSLLELELFFKDQASGHRCKDGAVGAQTVTLSMRPFTGNAVQKYEVRAGQ